jgi:two-component system OmpR family response regulator
MAAEETVLKVADLELNLIQRVVSRGGREIELRPREFHLLEYLLRNAGKVVTRTMLLERVWDFNFDPRTNVVETHISRLRGKIDKPFDEKLIKTVHGVGYIIDKTK